MSPPKVDGRTARRDRNRELVLDAVLDLFTEGQFAPAAPEVAERAGVSLRSVFRYFDDTEALLRAALARRIEVLAPLLEIPGLGVGPFEERLERFITCRLRLYHVAAPMARVTLARSHKRGIIAEQLAMFRAQNLHQLREMFDEELQALRPAQRIVAEAIVDTMFQFESLEHLFQHLDLSDANATKVLTDATRHALAPA